MYLVQVILAMGLLVYAIFMVAMGNPSWSQVAGNACLVLAFLAALYMGRNKSD